MTDNRIIIDWSNIMRLRRKRFRSIHMEIVSALKCSRP